MVNIFYQKAIKEQIKKFFQILNAAKTKTKVKAS